MADMIAGPGQGLPPPQAVYPPILWANPFTAPTNQVELQAAQALMIPAGTWIVGATVGVAALQYKDPVTCQWTSFLPTGAPWTRTVRSDGFNYRVANTSGSITGATVSAPGTGYTAGSTVVTPSAGNSTWTAIVGGSLGAATIVNGGSGYTIPPLVFVPSPPPCGIAAVGRATLTAGVVTGITWDNPGAGYTFPPPIVIVPAPNDPAVGVIQNATATVVLGGAGGVTGVLLQNAGAAVAAEPTLTITGTGTGAAATVLPATVVAAANDIITIQPSSGP